MRAVWKNTVLAESQDTVELEGNHYFPAESVERRYLRASDRMSTCPWKGTARYYDVVVGNAINPSAAWVYREPSAAAERIRGRIAFWKGVEVRA
jgi:uncharacterized protein (DUF427 family)